VLVVESVVFEREETRRGRPNATDSDGRERNASAATPWFVLLLIPRHGK
jgi:hypothetical protein